MKRVKEAIGYWTEDMEKGKYFGQGICIAILDSGIILHPDFDRRILEFTDFVGKQKAIYDDSGHGTHVAGILAGSGKMSDGIYQGMAPKSELVVGKVLDQQGNGTIQAVEEGIHWILELKNKRNIRIVNISVGAKPQLNNIEERNLLSAVEMLWDAGLVVVVSAGNYGPKDGTIAIPGSSRKVITVGSSDMLEGRSGISGRGPTRECVCKPDIVAPGNQIMSCIPGKPYSYGIKSGTSMSTPIVSGAIALLLEKYPDMTNRDVKLRLMETCRDMGLPKNQQGWGLLDVERLLR